MSVSESESLDDNLVLSIGLESMLYTRRFAIHRDVRRVAQLVAGRLRTQSTWTNPWLKATRRLLARSHTGMSSFLISFSGLTIHILKQRGVHHLRTKYSGTPAFSNHNGMDVGCWMRDRIGMHSLAV